MKGFAGRPLAIVALPLAMLAAGAQGQAATEAVNDLALRLYDALSTGDASKNIFFSPLSISTAFAFVHLGARGATRGQLEEALGFGAEGVAEALRKGRVALDAPEEGVEFLLANKLFLQEGFDVERGFRKGVSRGGLEETSFSEDPEGSRRLVNGFVSNATEGNIEELMPEGSVTTDTRLVIANAMYFRGAWEFPFEERLTKSMPFKGFEGTTTVNMMMQREVNLRIGSIPGAQVLELPYRGATVASMIIVLPNKPTKKAFFELESDLKSMSITDLLEGSSFNDVDVYLPRFGVEDTSNLEIVLPKLGVTDLFLPGVSDLSGIATVTPPLSVSSAIHKAKVMVDEKGTVAAAATAIAISLQSAAIEPPLEFKADHPFIYFLIDNQSKLVLFMGNVKELQE
ncbi:unnamed protein product [Ostreobium quekettii]|uniref:Serpin domain-containing protein n=1 Tax=Ostreobium quekettii TaxID=121088 RepID=A0A8S1ISS2_9CHLO|nr:unnamed protein product [Ostreobium quekettii]|eukprot:evm.model.scf_65.13 EVM.evm.TU.scf_65.13   scf_65:100186-102410(+)